MQGVVSMVDSSEFREYSGSDRSASGGKNAVSILDAMSLDDDRLRSVLWIGFGVKHRAHRVRWRSTLRKVHSEHVH